MQMAVALGVAGRRLGAACAFRPPERSPKAGKDPTKPTDTHQGRLSKQGSSGFVCPQSGAGQREWHCAGAGSLASLSEPKRPELAAPQSARRRPLISQVSYLASQPASQPLSELGRLALAIERLGRGGKPAWHHLASCWWLSATPLPTQRGCEGVPSGSAPVGERPRGRQRGESLAISVVVPFSGPNRNACDGGSHFALAIPPQCLFAWFCGN